MYIDIASDWPAYVFMAAFIVFMVYVIVKGHPKEVKEETKTEIKK